MRTMLCCALSYALMAAASADGKPLYCTHTEKSQSLICMQYTAVDTYQTFAVLISCTLAVTFSLCHLSLLPHGSINWSDIIIYDMHVEAVVGIVMGTAVCVPLALTISYAFVMVGIHQTHDVAAGVRHVLRYGSVSRAAYGFNRTARLLWLQQETQSVLWPQHFGRTAGS